MPDDLKFSCNVIIYPQAIHVQASAQFELALIRLATSGISADDGPVNPSFHPRIKIDQ